MTEERVAKLEAICARLDERTQHMDKTLTEIAKELKPLREAVARGKGGIYVLVLLAGAVGAGFAKLIAMVKGWQ